MKKTTNKQDSYLSSIVKSLDSDVVEVPEDIKDEVQFYEWIVSEKNERIEDNIQWT